MQHWEYYDIDQGKIVNCAYCKKLMRRSVFVHRKCIFALTCLYVNGLFCDDCVILLSNKELNRWLKSEATRKIYIKSLVPKAVEIECDYYVDEDIVDIEFDIIEEKNIFNNENDN